MNEIDQKVGSLSLYIFRYPTIGLRFPLVRDAKFLRRGFSWTLVSKSAAKETSGNLWNRPLQPVSRSV